MEQQEAELEIIKARLSSATPGPWSRLDAQIRHTQIDGWVDPAGRAAAQAQTENDIQFVMHAPDDISRLTASTSAVLSLHIAGDMHGTAYCKECSKGHYIVPSPCPTVAAITNALSGASR